MAEMRASSMPPPPPAIAPGSSPFLTSNSFDSSGMRRQNSAPLLASPAGSFVISSSAPAAPVIPSTPAPSTIFTTPTMATSSVMSPVSTTFAGKATPTSAGTPPASTSFVVPGTGMAAATAGMPSTPAPATTFTMPMMATPSVMPPVSTTFAGPVTPTLAGTPPASTSFVAPGTGMAAATPGMPQSTAGVPPAVPSTARLPPPSSLSPSRPQYQSMPPIQGPEWKTMPPQEMTPAFQSMPPDNFGRPSFNTMPPMGTPPGSMPPGPMPLQLGPYLTLQISSLLDIDVGRHDPVFKIRVYDDEDYQLHLTEDIYGIPEGPSGPDPDKQCISLGPFGEISLNTMSPLLFLQVERSGFLGSRIGRCQIHRLDPRSTQMWPYALSDRSDRPIGGIQLRVLEGRAPVMTGPPSMMTGPPPMMTVPPPPMMTGPPPPMMTVPPPPMMTGPLGPPPPMMTGLPPMMTGPPRPSMLSRPSNVTGRSSMSHASLKDPIDDIIATLVLNRVSDLPPPNPHQQLQLVFMSENGMKIGSAGPFVTQPQGQSNLHFAECNNETVTVKGPFRVGGTTRDGAMFVVIAASYAQKRARPEAIGQTLPILVNWDDTKNGIHELRSGTGSDIGSVKLNYTLKHQRTELQKQQEEKRAQSVEGTEMMQEPAKPVIPSYTRGRTGNFPPFSEEEALEQACLNFEAQNRANHQRIMIADPTVYEDGRYFHTVNGYREWHSLDSLFATMGPNPVLQSEEVGPSMTRAYQEASCLFPEVEKRIRLGLPPRPLSPQDMEIDGQLLRTLYPANPFKVDRQLRPVACKSPDAIAEHRDMSWCPDPPFYAPLRNMTEEDKETLRLAQYAPNQCAKLWFADVNPNYNYSEDIWGVFADNREAHAAFIRSPEQFRRRRVKDDCMMS